MCRRPIVLLLAMTLLSGFRAVAVQYAFQVNFTDKNNSPYSLSAPLSYLSSQSVNRRTTQGIAIDSSDLPVNPAYIDSVLTITGGEMHEVSRWFNMCVILLSDSATIHLLDGKPYIQSTRLVAYYTGILHKPAPEAGNNGPARKTTSGDSGYYEQAWDQTNLVHGDFLHDNGFDGTGKLIAVIDAGFIGADTHPGFNNLWSSGRVIDKHNFTLASGNIFGYDTHGMKVLSTMAGYVPGTYVGSAPLASYALYISEDGGSEQPIELINMVCAAERADSIGADIITTSLGYNTFDNPAWNFNFSSDFDGKTTIAAQAANKATAKGILFVATAGNEGGNSWNNILTPGDADSALTIGSVEVTGAVAGNSGYGPNAAGQTKPDVCGLGQPAAIFETGGGYGTESGTSFSTPQIAGWAACLWQSKPAATPSQLRLAIDKCASSYTSPGNHVGYGIADFRCALQMILEVPIPPLPANHGLINVFPNPCSNIINLSISPDTEQYVDISLIDIAGKTVNTFHQYFNKGYNAPLQFSTAELPCGIYILKAVSPTKQNIVKIEKL